MKDEPETDQEGSYPQIPQMTWIEDEDERDQEGNYPQTEKRDEGCGMRDEPKPDQNRNPQISQMVQVEERKKKESYPQISQIAQMVRTGTEILFDVHPESAESA